MKMINKKAKISFYLSTIVLQNSLNKLISWYPYVNVLKHMLVFG